MDLVATLFLTAELTVKGVGRGWFEGAHAVFASRWEVVDALATASSVAAIVTALACHETAEVAMLFNVLRTLRMLRIVLWSTAVHTTVLSVIEVRNRVVVTVKRPLL